MLKRYLQLILIVLPILLLMLFGLYFGYKNWDKYSNNVVLESHLKNTKLLQSLEHSIFNEVVCVATVGSKKSMLAKVCKKTEETTNNIMQQITEQKDDVSLYNLKNNILKIRKSIKNNPSDVIKKLVNGKLNKELNVFIDKYSTFLGRYSDKVDKKEYFNLYTDISKISSSTDLEKVLIGYYLSYKKPIPSSNLIYWDNIINDSQVLELDDEKISISNTAITDVFKKEEFQKTLRLIEDIRLDIMTNSSNGQYKSNISTWVSLLNKKQKVLNGVEKILLDTIFNDTSKVKNKSLFICILSLIVVFFALLGFFLFLFFWKKEKVNNILLDDLVGKISDVNDNKLEITDTIKNPKVVYNYIAASYENLHEKEVRIHEENKANKFFINNLAYEVRTPLNGISGYTKLLKETSLNIEQNDYLNMIENSFENLDIILRKLSEDKSLSNQKTEVACAEFDIVKQIESSVETFSIKADQKDIVLGLYIDPTLNYKVKGDGVKLSQVITNLIENALDVSSAYHTIDIIVKQMDSDENNINIKFNIIDQGIGFSEDELTQIRNGLNNFENNINVGNINMNNLSITSKIIKQMGGRLECKSKKSEGTDFFFTLTFVKNNDENELENYPTFHGMKVGLALPSHDINRTIDKNLENYVKFLNCSFEIYDYETLFESENSVELPELLFVYHNYARLDGELEKFTSLPIKIALITSSSLRARLNTEQFRFSSVTYAPVSMRKITKILEQSRLHDTPDAVEVIEKNETIKELNKFEGLDVLLVEENDISQKIFSNMLKKLGMNVTLSSRGTDAFELRKEKEFNIILMDVDTLTVSGKETTSKILYYEGVNQLTHVPIIALTQDLNDSECSKYLKLGMDDCIHRKIDELDMHSLIYKHCIEGPKKAAQSEEDELIAKVLSGDFLKL